MNEVSADAIARAVNTVARISFPGYKFVVLIVGDAAAIRVEYEEPDVMSGIPEGQRGRVWLLNPEWNEMQIVQTCETRPAPILSQRRDPILRKEAMQGVKRRRCRVCKCTDDDCRQCVEKTGAPCHWVEGDLCSACVTSKRRKADMTSPERGKKAAAKLRRKRVAAGVDAEDE